MAFHTENYCDSLEELNKTDAIRAIHQALLQFKTGEAIGFDNLDNRRAIEALTECLKAAGHRGFVA